MLAVFCQRCSTKWIFSVQKISFTDIHFSARKVSYSGNFSARKVAHIDAIIHINLLPPQNIKYFGQVFCKKIKIFWPENSPFLVRFFLPKYAVLWELFWQKPYCYQKNNESWQLSTRILPQKWICSDQKRSFSDTTFSARKVPYSGSFFGRKLTTTR